MLPLMEELDENISDSISSRERRKTTSKVSIKLDKTSSASQLPRSSRKPSSKKKEFGCQVMSYGVDEATNDTWGHPSWWACKND